MAAYSPILMSSFGLHADRTVAREAADNWAPPQPPRGHSHSGPGASPVSLSHEPRRATGKRTLGALHGPEPPADGTPGRSLGSSGRRRDSQGPQEPGRWRQEVGRPGQEEASILGSTAPGRGGPSPRPLASVLLCRAAGVPAVRGCSFRRTALGGGCNLRDITDLQPDPERVPHCVGTGTGSGQSV